MRIRPRPAAPRDDRGITLVELQVGAVIGILVGTLALVGLVGTWRTSQAVTTASTRLTGGLVDTAQLSGDLRDARRVVDPASAAVPASACTALAPSTTPRQAFAVWLDVDKDYECSPAEIVVWAVEAVPPAPARLCRTSAGQRRCLGVRGERESADVTFTPLLTDGLIRRVRVVLTPRSTDPAAPLPAAQVAASTHDWSVDMENLR